MIKCKVENCGGIPSITVNGNKINACAYMTYFDENSRAGEFAKKGYKLFSVCAYFSDLPINEYSGFSPCRGNGIFEYGEDYSEFDRNVRAVLEKCPDAYIFPRVYITMPRAWTVENPTEVAKTTITPTGRELLYSKKFRRDGGELLKKFIRHTEQSDYADNIIGYQVSGGQTQEWFYFDLNGGFCQNALPYYKEYMHKNGAEVSELPKEADETYYRFCNVCAAETVEHFARIAKEESGKIVGAFYGYSVEVNSPGFGTHALGRIADSQYIDFFCSPVSYRNLRALKTDSADMIPRASVCARGKMYFTEADIRTHLSDYPEKSRKDIKLTVPYRGAVWKGGHTTQDDILHLRKVLAKCLCSGKALWWFDMWGGWYDSVIDVMEEYNRILNLPGGSYSSKKCKAAVFIDETAPKGELCITVAACGVPYDIFLAQDYFLAKDYGLFISLTENNEDMRIYAQNNNIPCFCAVDMNKDEISHAIDSCRFTRVNRENIVYLGNGFIALHGVKTGETQLCFDKKVRLTDVENKKRSFEGEIISVFINECETAIFKIEEV